MNKIKFLKGLLLILGVALMTVSCDDNDNLKRQYYHFGGEKREIATVARTVEIVQTRDALGPEREFHGFYMFDNKALEQGADYSVYMIMVSSKLGDNIDVTGEPQDWNFAFIDSVTGKKYDTYLDGSPTGDITSGQFKVSSLGGGRFEIAVDVVFSDGKSLKVNYSGMPFLEINEPEPTK